MGRYNLPPQIALSDSGPPPNANFHPAGKHQTLQGHGSPENIVLGYAGDEYLDLDTGDKWNKMGPTDEPRRATVDGWEVEGGSESGDVTSTGTTTARVVGDRWAESRNVKDFGALTNGTDARASIVAALAAWDEVRFSTGSYTISTDLTVAAGKVLVFEPGAKLKPASGVKITINGEVQAGRHEIFDYSVGGKVVFTSVGIGVAPGTLVVFPEWYGAKADNTGTDNAAAFGRYYDQTLLATENQHPLQLGMGYYSFLTGFTGRSNMVIRGHPNGKTRLQFRPSAASGSARFITVPDAVDNPIFENVEIIAGAVTVGVRTTAIGHSLDTDLVTAPVFRNVAFTGWNYAAIDFARCTYLRMIGGKFVSVSNIAANGGTASESAVCVSFRQYGNAISLEQGVRASNCECLLVSASSANLVIQEGAFEQGASAPLDAIASRGHFIEIKAGSDIHVMGNYFEGILTAYPKAIFSVNAIKGWSFDKNQVSTFRPSESVSAADVIVSQTGASYGGCASNNELNGRPASYYIYEDGTGGVITAIGNCYRDSSGTIETTLTSSAFAAKFTTNVGLTTPLDWNFARAQWTRLTINTTGVLTPITLEKRRSGGAGAAGDGLAIAFRLMNGSGSIQNAGNVKWVFSNPNASAEDVNIIFTSLGNGAITTPLTIFGEGGLLMPVALSNPAAPAADNAALYADSSGGKVRLMARFPTGAVQQIAIEP